MFLYQKWLVGEMHRYVTAASHPTLRGRPVVLSPRQYGAALMQTYLGKASLKWIAGVVNVSVEGLVNWRREPEFLRVMDGSKAQFSEIFQESLRFTDYPLDEVNEIAGEFSLLEDSLRITVRTRLYQTLKNLGESLESRQRSGVSMEEPDLRRFRRLFLFFWVLEHNYWPSPARRRLEERFLPVAREVVWPRLGPTEFRIDPELHYSAPHLLAMLARELKASFRSLPDFS
jgi:hypothetical protein